MKFLRVVSLMLASTALLFQTSCMSLDMIAHAEGTTPPTDPYGRPYDPMPGYYALVPLVLPLDLITLPVQYFYFQSARQQAQSGRPVPHPTTPPPPVY